MSKKKGLLLVLLGAALGVAGAAGTYLFTAENVAWREYIEGEIIPLAFLVIAAAFTMWGTAKPLVTRVLEVLSLFSRATDDVAATVKTGAATKEALAEQERKIAELREEYRNTAAALEKTVKLTADMVRIGFCNSSELVKKGYAAEIERLVGEHEEK